MGVVGGSRHYVGGGLGDERGWKCPSCGAENLGLIAQGCQLCGAGTPGHRVEPPPAPPSPTTPPPSREDYALRDEVGESLAERWAREYPDATIADAFTAGYIEGVRETRRQQLAQPAPVAPPPPLPPDAIITRTVIAALELFRDQILVDTPEEIASGEWLSVEQVNDFIAHLRPVAEAPHG
jgi:hypothetical protein